MKRIAVLLAFAVLAGGYTLWERVYSPRAQLQEAWQGEVIHRYTARDRFSELAQLHIARDGEPQLIILRHYLRVRLDGGGVEDVEVPRETYRDSRLGDTLVKASGVRWPEVEATLLETAKDTSTEVVLITATD